jgi:hypothetical protein
VWIVTFASLVLVLLCMWLAKTPFTLLVVSVQRYETINLSGFLVRSKHWLLPLLWSISVHTSSSLPARRVSSPTVNRVCRHTRSYVEVNFPPVLVYVHSYPPLAGTRF